jgi:hypothetical protein
MFYIKSNTKYIEECEEFEKTGERQPGNYFCVVTIHNDDNGLYATVEWEDGPSPLNREQLVLALQAIDANEMIHVSTGGYSN